MAEGKPTLKDRFGRHWPILVLILLPLFPLWRAIFLGQTIGPWDQIRHFAPWNGPASDKPWDILQADACLQFYVWRDMVFHAWGSGHIPAWNPYQLGGAPLLANSQSGAFYPLHILVGILHIPTPIGITLLAWFHLAWAGIGTFFLIKRLGGNDIGALLGGGGFILSGFLVAWTPLSSVVTTVCWIPWAFLAAYALGDKPLNWKFAPVGLALCVAMMLLAGHLQFAAYGMLATAIIVICRAFQGGWKTLVLGLLAFMVGAIIASPQLTRVLQNGSHSHRRNVPTWEGFQGYNSGAIQPFELLSLPDSTLLGTPDEGSLKVGGQTVTGYWPAFVQRGASFAETAIGLGPLLLAALILGWSALAIRKAWPVAVVGVVGLLLAMGTIVGAILYFGIPGWSATASPGRASILFVLSMAVLAGVTFNQTTAPEPARKTGRRLAIVAAILLAAAAGVSQFPLVSWLPQLSADVLADTRPTTMTLLFKVALGLVAVVLVWLALSRSEDETRKPSQRQILAAIGALVVFAIPSTFLIPTGDSNLPQVQTSADRVAFINGPWDLLQAPAATMPPNLAAIYHIHELGGYDSLVDKAVKDRLNDIDGGDPSPLANGNILFVKSSADPAKLAEAGVTEVWSRKRLPGFAAVEPQEDSLFHYPLPGPGRASINGVPAKLVDESADSETFEAQGPGSFVVRDNLDPKDWEVQVDNAKANFTAAPWPTLNVENGIHHVRFHYRSGSTFDFLGPLIFVASLLFFGLNFARSRTIKADESNPS